MSPQITAQQRATSPLVHELLKHLPVGDQMTYEEKIFWLEIGATLGEDQLHNLARVVAFMRKTGGF